MSGLTGDDTPSPQVGSPKADSDVNDSPNHPPVVGEEGEKEGGGKEEEENKGEDEGKGEDPCTRSEGMVHFVLTDLTSLESRLSDPVIIRNVPW